jgi:hypothetical protein
MYGRASVRDRDIPAQMIQGAFIPLNLSFLGNFFSGFENKKL